MHHAMKRLLRLVFATKKYHKTTVPVGNYERILQGIAVVLLAILWSTNAISCTIPNTKNICWIPEIQSGGFFVKVSHCERNIKAIPRKVI